MKTCGVCKEEKPRESFYKDSRSKDGLQGCCKDCTLEYNNTYYQKNKDRLKAKGGTEAGLEALKYCGICKTEKASGSFYRNSWAKDGLATCCAECRDKYQTQYCKENTAKVNALKYQWTENNPERAREHNRNGATKIRLKKYGLTFEQWDEMKLAQGGFCAICGLERPLAIDHNHVTGKVRALLCMHCNTAIGHLQDSVEVVAKALEYLKKHSET